MSASVNPAGSAVEADPAVAELIVMGDYQGPGEKNTAETLARELASRVNTIR